MTEAKAYSCPQCSAPLALDPDTGKLHCEFCEGYFDVASLEKMEEAAAPAEEPKKNVAKGRKAKEKEAREERAKKQKLEAACLAELTSYTVEEWEERLSTGSQAMMEDVVCYTCHNCGAQVVTDKLTVATSCQYCGSNVVVDQRVSGSLRPSHVIPFKIKASAIADNLEKFYAKRPLLPKNFFHDNQVGEVQGIYVPFWVYKGTVDGNGTYRSHDTECYSSGNDDVTEVTEYTSKRIGTASFRGIPVDASERIDDDLMDSIEPFNYSGLVPFEGGYLTGFVAERFDKSPREVFDRAGNRMKTSCADMFDDDLPGSFVDSRKATFEFSDAKAAYVMLPVYLFNCKYGGKLYRYAVNGQTGKIVGEVPTSKSKSLASFGKGFAKGMAKGLIAAAVVIAIIVALIV